MAIKQFDPSAWVWNEATQAEQQSQRDRWRNLHMPFYLYYKRGGLCLASRSQDGWTLGDGGRVPTNQTSAGLTAWIVERAKRLPCLPEV